MTVLFFTVCLGAAADAAISVVKLSGEEKQPVTIIYSGAAQLQPDDDGGGSNTLTSVFM